MGREGCGEAWQLETYIREFSVITALGRALNASQHGKHGKLKETKLEAEKQKANELKNAENIPPKKWWNLAKSYLKNDKSDCSQFPPLKVNDNMICDEKEKAEAFNTFFLAHSTIDDSHAPVPDDATMVDHLLPNIKMKRMSRILLSHWI